MTYPEHETCTAASTYHAITQSFILGRNKILKLGGQIVAPYN